MKIKHLRTALGEYNPEAEVGVVACDQIREFTLTYGGGDLSNPKTAETVLFHVDRLSRNDLVEPPTEQHAPKPCALLCPKCGGTDVHRRFWQADETWWRYEAHAPSRHRTRSNALVDVGERTGRALRDCVTHHCRTCQWDWDTAPIEQAEDHE